MIGKKQKPLSPPRKEGGGEVVDMVVEGSEGVGKTTKESVAGAGPGAGAVSGTDWGITQAGTTFANNSWRFTNNTGSALLDWRRCMACQFVSHPSLLNTD